VKTLNYFLLLSFLTAGVVIYSGCSASSNSVRYNEKQEESKEKPRSVRFTSEDDNKKNSIDTSFESINSDEEDLPVDKRNVDISKLVNNSEGSEFSTVKEKMLMEILKYINTPYKYGGNSSNGIDCSAFTQQIFMNSLSIPLLRTAQDQYMEGTSVDNINQLRFGDLVFFDTRRSIKPGHVGIYLGDKLFAHASSKQGVTVSSLTLDYYSKRFMGGRRIEEIYGTNSSSK
jgi:cell wall-associated NlpC family hydrolase